MNDDVANSAAARPSRVVAVCIACGAVAIALLTAVLAPSPAPVTVATEPAQIESKLIGTNAPLDFTLQDINGVAVNLATFKGKVLIVNFWATWCPPCRAEIPGLVELQTAHQHDVVVLGLLVQDPISTRTKPFVSSMNMNYPILDANDRPDIENAFGGPFWGIPASIIIGRDGRFASKHAGITTREALEQEIRPLL